MNVDVYWADEARDVLQFDIYHWDWEDLFQARDAVCELLETNDRYISLLIVCHNPLKVWPANPLVNIRKFAERDSDKIDRIFVIGADEIVLSMYNMLERAAGRLSIHNKVQFVNTLDDALKGIA